METVAKKSIRRKVAKRVVVAMIITIIALSTVNLIYMSRRIVNEQKTELELATMLVASQIDGWSREMGEVTCNVADTLEGLNTIDERTVKRVLNQIADTHKEFCFVYVATEEGNMYMGRGVSYATGVDPRERDWYKKAKAAGHTVVIDPYISASRPDVMLATVATPIYFGTKMVGVAAVDANVSTINEYVNSISFKEGAYGFLVDTEGNIVAHPNDAYVPNVKSVSKVDEVMPEISEIIKKPGSDTVVAKDYNGISMVYFTKRLEHTKWTIGVAYPEKYILKIIDRGIRICIVMAMICIFLSAADMTMAIRKILLPLDKINPAMERLMQGDLKTPIEISSDADELGAMQNRMGILIRRLSDIIETQKYVLGQMEKGNLTVEDCPEYPGDLAEITSSVNSIKEAFNDIISDIQFSAINLQSFAMGINETSDLEEMRSVFEELSEEANILMEKTSRFKTIPK